MWKQFVGVLLLCALVVATVLGGVIGFSWMQARSSAIEAPDMATFQTLSEANLRGVGGGPGASKKQPKVGDAQKDGDKKPDATKPAGTNTAAPDKDKKDQAADKKDKPVESKVQPAKEGPVKPQDAAKEPAKTEPVKTPEKSSVPHAAEKKPDSKPADPAGGKKSPDEAKKPS